MIQIFYILECLYVINWIFVGFSYRQFDEFVEILKQYSPVSLGYIIYSVSARTFLRFQFFILNTKTEVWIFNAVSCTILQTSTLPIYDQLSIV